MMLLPIPRTPNPVPPRERGFAFLMVLMLMGVASIVIAVALQRAAVHSNIVVKQLEGYRAHHEMLGIRDYSEWWLMKRENDSKQLAKYADLRQVAHRLVLDDGTVILISVQEGQGTVLRNLTNIKDDAARRWLVEMLARIPADRPDLVRRSGAWQVSIRSAPDEILDAMVGFDPGAAAALREARDRGISNATELQMALERNGVEPLVSQALMQSITFEPTLWRLNVEAVHPEGVNRYTLLVEKRANLTKMHEWRPVTEAEAERTFTSGLDFPGQRDPVPPGGK